MRPLASNLFCLAVAVSLTACVADKATTGQVSLPIQTVGSDGAVYHLPPNTRLTFATTTMGSIANYDVGLDGNTTAVSFTAAAGSYQAQLYNTDQTYTTEWPLLRTDMTGTKTVTATLTTVQPVAVAVTANNTTNLVFQFSIASGGTITFGDGTVSVGVGVGSGSASSFTASAQGSGDVSGSPSITGPYASQLAAALPAAGVTGLQVSVAVTLTGPWQEAGGSIDADATSLLVCAPIQVTSISGSGNAAYADLLAESGHGSSPSFLFGPASLCIDDLGTSEEIRIRTSREGLSETATFWSIFGSGQPAVFWNVLRGTLPSRVYNSTAGTLDLGALAGTYTLPMHLVTRVGADISNIWYFENITGQMTFSFVAHP